MGAGLAEGSLFVVEPSVGAQKLKFGIIGCGGRGSAAVKDFTAACKIHGCEAELVAAGDAFKDKADALGKAHKLVPERCFGGFDNYKNVIASGCDYVLMATPPSFRPLHFDAAVEAGKHCFIEKPVAVEPVGARGVIDAGAIGEIKGGVVQWNGTVPWIKRRNEGESNASYLARNWLDFNELSGDHIVEQHFHNLDVAVWLLGRLPVTTIGLDGRARRETGNMSDFFSVDLDFGDDVHIHSQCRQLAGSYGRIGELFTGTEGVCYGGGKLKGK